MMMTGAEKIKNFSLCLLALLFFIYLFAIYDTSFSGPDKPIYFAYTASMVEDGDLNAVNHLDNSYPYRLASGKIGISKTYNLPDFHNHGGIVLWVPFYAYGKFVYQASERLDLKNLIEQGYGRVTRCAMSFSTILFGFLTLLLTYKLARVFFPRGISIASTLALFFGTPFFYFVVKETGNANVIACLFSVVSIWLAAHAVNMGKRHWLLYGMFFSLCMIVKVDLCLQLFFIFILFTGFLLFKKTSWLCVVSFLSGLVAVFGLKTFSGYIKYGTLHPGIFGTLNLRGDYLLEQLFSSYRGIFYTSPLFYICALGLLLVLINITRKVKKGNAGMAMDDIFILILSSYLILKICLLGFRFAWGGGTCGARPLLTEFPVFVLLFARALSLRRKYLLWVIGSLSVLFILWNFLVVAEYKTQLDMRYIGRMPDLLTRIEAVKKVPGAILLTVKDLDLKLRSAIPLLLFSCAGIIWFFCRWKGPQASSFWYVKSQNPGGFYKTLAILTAYLCLAYAVFTLSNAYNNPKKVQRLKAEGFFSNAVILSPDEFTRAENAGSMQEMIDYYTLKGDLERVEKIRRHKKELYGDNG